MDDFIGREDELQQLEDAYRRDDFQIAVVYGRRRVGKTTLLREFCTNKRTIFYTAIKTLSPERNIERLSKSVMETLSPETSHAAFNNMSDMLDYIGKCGETERLVVVLDEFPHFASHYREIVSLLQVVIDEQWLFGKIFLILCGSSISFMEDEVLAKKSPLFGRRTMQLKLEPFDYRRCALFAPDWPNRDKAILFGITGGIAKYLSLIDMKKTVDENIIDLFFTKTGYLYEEPDVQIGKNPYYRVLAYCLQVQ